MDDLGKSVIVIIWNFHNGRAWGDHMNIWSDHNDNLSEIFLTKTSLGTSDEI